MHRVLSFAPIFCAFLACSSGSDGPAAGGTGPTGGSGSGMLGSFLGACDTRGVDGTVQGQCRDWMGDGSADLETSCDFIGGSFDAATPCPTATRVGSCELDEVLGTVAVYRYYAPDYDATTAADHCDGLEGTYSDGSGGAGGASSGGAGGSSAGSGGTTATGGTTSTGGSSQNCPPECFRPYQCVEQCGDEPRDFGCCPCPEGLIDTISCG